MLIQNSDVGRIAREQAGLTLAEGYPQNLLSNVQPVLDITPRNHRLIKIINASSQSSTTGGTVLSGNNDVDRFITMIQYHMIKDVTCDTATGTAGVRTNIDGVGRNIAQINILTTTAQSELVQIDFNRPIKIDRNASITFTQPTFTTGAMARSVTVGYYEVQ